jgi:hypothetical protein
LHRSDAVGDKALSPWILLDAKSLYRIEGQEYLFYTVAKPANFELWVVNQTLTALLAKSY